MGYGHTFACSPFFMIKILHRLPILFCWLSCAFFSQAQVTLRLVALPANSPSKDSLFFAGNLNRWNPGDTNYLFKTGTDHFPTLVIPEGKGTIPFKITRGNWAKAEADSSGNDTGNRSFSFTGSPQTIDLVIRGWKAQVASVSTAATNVKVLSDSFAMPQLGRKRRIWLYLPPDYQSSQKHYPVIYMHDGQNLFDNLTSFSGEWGVDETLNQLFEQGDYGTIVVGIDNGGEKRLDEYSPWKNPSYGGGEGAAYMAFLVQTLKPYIDSNFRTLKGPESTALFGSSMGALISTYGAATYPAVFGKVGAFSPAYWFSISGFVEYLQTNTSDIHNLKIFHLAGENESASMVNLMEKVNGKMLEKGLQKSHSKVKIDADGTHSETYWKREFEGAYRWLFTKESKSH